MGAQLDIKDEATIRLAQNLTDASGRSVTATIRHALEREAAEREALVQQKIARIDEMVAEFQRHMPEEWKTRTSKEIMDSIYDDDQEDGFAR